VYSSPCTFVGVSLSIADVVLSIVYKQSKFESVVGKHQKKIGMGETKTRKAFYRSQPTNAKGMEGQQAHKGGAQYVPAEKRKRDRAEGGRGRGGRGGQQPRGGGGARKKKGSYDTGSSGRLPEGPQVERISEYFFCHMYSINIYREDLYEISNQASTLLTDEDIQSFIMKGYHIIQTDLPFTFHDSLYKKIDSMEPTMKKNPGNNILPALPELLVNPFFLPFSGATSSLCFLALFRLSL